MRLARGQKAEEVLGAGKIRRGLAPNSMMVSQLARLVAGIDQQGPVVEGVQNQEIASEYAIESCRRLLSERLVERRCEQVSRPLSCY